MPRTNIQTAKRRRRTRTNASQLLAAAARIRPVLLEGATTETASCTRGFLQSSIRVFGLLFFQATVCTRHLHVLTPSVQTWRTSRDERQYRRTN